ncbi:MAG: hypothetical protein IJZ55_04750 [Lachnospiraceae bacterium]|nr:hypothetical protein [Lachnospiraceae bacterium]
MDRKEFVERVCRLGIDCIILDDDLINPNEIVVFTKKKKAVSKEMKKQGEVSVVTERGTRRHIRVISYKEAGITSWEQGLKEEGIKLNDRATLLNEEDSVAVFLYYAFVCVQTENWLYHNILHVIKKRLGYACEEDLKRWLAEYIKKKKYGIEVNKILELPQELLDVLSPFKKKKIAVGQIRRKVVRKLGIKRIGIIAKAHYLINEGRYLDYIKKNSVVGNDWKMVHVEGASACIYIRDVREDKAYFLKGNEMSNYRGVTNEIFIQKRLLEQSKDTSWFLPMDCCDNLKRWIRYEYVTWPLLSRYIEERDLTEQERKLLGDYLIEVLDKLYSMNIVHNDLRGDNIMVRTREDGTLEGFILIDFGCASCNGSVPWNRDSFLGRYLDRNGCGKMRYNEVIVDDAASALLVYLNAGGNPEDENARKIRERIGRLYFLCEE